MAFPQLYKKGSGGLDRGEGALEELKKMPGKKVLVFGCS